MNSRSILHSAIRGGVPIISALLILCGLATAIAQPTRIAPAREMRKPLNLLAGAPEEGETIYLTHQRRITWVAESSREARLTLERNDRHVNTIGGGLPARGSTTWLIGSKGPDEPAAVPGGGYRLVLLSPKGTRLASSKMFSIRSPQITILSPRGDSETVRGDRPTPINWRSRNLEGQVRIWVNVRTNTRPNETIQLGISDNSNHRRGNRYTAKWMEDYTSRRNNWERGVGRIRIESATVPSVGVWGEEFPIANTGR